ncbi:MAG TPA: alpha/beta hydrolase [Pseudolysinimonas sp.]|jgi:pimeloyl-ACP methyl ester carboxylesterase
MPVVKVAGAELSYDVAGDPGATAVLFVHAGVATRAMWDPQFDDLARDHFVIRYDTRGYGDSPGDDVAFADRDDLIAVLDAVGVDKACLVGCSRGGRIALDAALDAPTRVTGLVTIGSTPGGQAKDGATDRELEMLADMKAAAEAEDIDAIVRTEVAFWDLGPSRDVDDVDPEFLQRAIELNVGAAHWDFAGLDQPLDPPAVARLHEITVPALVVVGDLDVTESKLGYELLMAGLPQAEGLRFPDSAHLPSVERAEQFTSDLRAWLAAHSL